MSTKLLTPRRVLIALWVVLPVLAMSLYWIAGSMHDGWQARPPTETEITDCRLEAMMDGDNPVEVERIHNACLAAVNEAYVQPRTWKMVVGFSGLFLLYAAGLGVVTWRRVAPGSA